MVYGGFAPEIFLNMQIKIFTIPITGGEAMEAALNAFLRGQKILQVEQQLVSQSSGSCWTFCVQYIDGASQQSERRRSIKKDYKAELSEEAFTRFVELRKVRKAIAEEDSVPAFAIFTDEHMAALAQLPELTLASMQQVKGIGEKKAAKYGERIIAQFNW
jgi:superfamily II DNA helicase RecQ